MHDDVIKWKHFPHNWPFVRGSHRSPVNSPHKGQWRRALMFSLNCVWINDWVNNREAGDLRRYGAHYDVIVMIISRNRSNFSHGTPKLPTTITATSPFHSHFMFISRKTVLTLKQDPVFPSADPIWSIPPSHQSTNYPSITLSQLTSPDLHHYHYMQISANTHSQIPTDWDNSNLFL